ncbi:MAG: prenyltransferase [Gammaproteobacteria bacterium CG_4_10_14_0_8_um_filter_38_16]|nr:MAG: prenyltransferase [Gammaproteobacteria bacterium CG_4_10_14_0_8_um_filter_38_16]PJA04394.1 MAG: prenyltransferase [Gammaproteobacteria bacterium CG_4_10_14_0_2_um_filter_38_22]PJB10185.1 MAG: prenyltransferase [Gammaproteobacteria bacterium CG_4_9_14_3_um_filter_38_9]
MDTFFSLIRLLRPADWIKNIFLFAPLFFTPSLFHFPEVSIVFLGAVIFSVNASAIYVFNDIRDRVTDCSHPQKKWRPIACGKISLLTAYIVFVILSAGSLIAAVYLSHLFFVILLGYYLLNILYSYFFKKIAIIDIYCIAAGFILRLLAGAALINVQPSVWILMCTGLLALFLAFAKRRDDVVHHFGVSHRESIKKYNLIFIDTSISIILGALLIAYTIYTTQAATASHLDTRHYAWTVPLVLLGILRYLQITLVEEKSGSPTRLLCTDRFLLGTTIAWVILSAMLMY